MKLSLNPIIWVLFLSDILTGCSLAPVRPEPLARGDYDSTRTYIEKLIRYQMAKNQVMGLSIGLVDDQKLVWAEGFGYADRERKIPATPATLYRVGSISKLFTDTAAMQLVEEGRLDLDHPLSEYLPGFAIREHDPDAGPITIRQLLTHHSGLPRDRLQGFFTATPAPFVSLVEDLRDEYAAYPPGEIFSYSNLGVSLLGAAVQQVGGAPFAEYLQHKVLAPLDMKQASFTTGPSDSPLMAKGYRGLEAAKEPALRDVPAGGLNAGITEMSRFISMIFADGESHGKQLLRAATVAEMLRPQNLNVPLDLNFRVGLGWMLSSVGASTIKNGGPVAHHSGGTILFRSQMYLLPEHKLGVVVLSNSSTAMGVVDQIANESLKLALEAKTGIRQPEPVKEASEAVELPEKELDSFIGDYTTMIGYARISRQGKHLKAEALGSEFNLLPRSDGGLHLDYTLLGFFHLNLGPLGEIGLSRRQLAGRELLVAKAGGQELLIGQKVTPPAGLGAWRERLGVYEITDPGDDYQSFKSVRLLEDHGLLLVKITPATGKQTTSMVLTPLSDTEARLAEVLADGGETVRVVQVDGSEQIAFSGYLLKRN